MGALTDLWNSERGVFAVALVLGATALVIFNKLTVDQWVDFAKWIFATYAGSKAITTAVASFAAAPKPTSLAVTSEAKS